MAWTLFVWVSRVRNVLADDDLGAGRKLAWLVPAALFLAGALAVAAVGARRRPRILAVFAALTVVWWLVRAPLVVVSDHGVGFKAVHVVLAAISIALAVWAWREGRPAGTA